MNTRTKGLLATMISAVFFGFIPLFVKTICAGGGNSVSAAFYRFFLSVPILYIYLKAQGISMRITRTEFAKIALITIFGYGGTAVLLFSSYNFIPSGMSTTIHFMYPVFTILGCMIFFKEKVSPLKLLCVALCFGGILLFYNGESGGSVLGMALSFLSGVTYAFYTIYLEKSGLQKMENLKLIFYMNTVAAAMILVMALLTAQFTLRLTPLAWGTAVFFATATSLIGVLGYQIGVKCIGPQNAAILSTFEPITSVIVGVLVYREAFSARTLLGCLCVLSAVVIVAKMKE
ncbi:MAG: DMT family transporter [Clostridia bacterium]